MTENFLYRSKAMIKTNIVLLVIALLLQFSLTETVCITAPPSWITDNKGCKVWNPSPTTDESIEWTGRCVDGYADGYGIITWQKNGINNGETHYNEDNGLILKKGKTTANITNQDYTFILSSCEEEKHFLGKEKSAKIYVFSKKDFDFVYNNTVSLYLFDKAIEFADENCFPLMNGSYDSNKLFVHIFKNDIDPKKHPGVIIKKPARLNGSDDENILHNDIIIEYENIPINNENDLSKIWKRTISKKGIKVKLIREDITKNIILPRSTSSSQSYPEIEEHAVAKAKIYVHGSGEKAKISWSGGEIEYKVFPLIEYTNNVRKNYDEMFNKQKQERITRENRDREIKRKIEEEKRAKAEEKFNNKAKANYDNFNKKYKIQHWLTIDDLKVNPFIYEGKRVAIETTFEKMITAEKAIFGDDVIASDIPKGLFSKQASIILAGKVLGNEAVKTPFGGEVLLPHLKFIGAYFCETWGCRDIAK